LGIGNLALWLNDKNSKDMQNEPDRHNDVFIFKTLVNMFTYIFIQCIYVEEIQFLTFRKLSIN